MDNISSGVAIRVISTIILRILGFGPKSKELSNPKFKFKIICRVLAVLSRFLMLFLILYGFSWGITEGFDSTKAVTGFAYAFILLLLTPILGLLSR